VFAVVAVHRKSHDRFVTILKSCRKHDKWLASQTVQATQNMGFWNRLDVYAPIMINKVPFVNERNIKLMKLLEVWLISNFYPIWNDTERKIT
jgi:hypothetical protein